MGEFTRSREEADTLVELARRVADPAAEASALAQLASALQWDEDFPAARERAEQAIEIAERVGAEEPVAAALYVRGYVNALNGRLEASEADVGRALAIGRKIGDASRQALALHFLAIRHSWQGRYQDCLAAAEEGIRIGRERRLAVPLLRCLWNQGLALHELGDHDGALSTLAEGFALAEKIGDESFIPRYLNTIGWVRIDCGDFAEGIAISERSYDVTARSSRAGHATGAERFAFIRINQADALMARGDLAAAAEALNEAHQTVRHPPPSQWMTWRYTVHCYASFGQLALLRGDADGARRWADQSLAGSMPSASQKYESWAWRIKGESATMRRAWNEADEALRRALAIAETIGQPRQLWLSELALGRLQTALGKKHEARECYRAALSTITAVRERTREPGLRAGLESAPAIREIETLARD